MIAGMRKGANTIALHSRKQRNATYLDVAILIDDGSGTQGADNPAK